MSKIVSIGTQVPANAYTQEEVLHFMQLIYACSPDEFRKIKYLYHHSGIDTRYSVIPDYNLPTSEWTFYSPTENLEPFPSIEKRMAWYNEQAPKLAIGAIQDCLGTEGTDAITHLITVSCTGMSAPGLDLQILEAMRLPPSLFRSSVNFMGCYAAIHGLKWADSICRADPAAKVMVVCVELCSLHFQSESTPDNISSGMLFSDGAAAVLVTGDDDLRGGFRLDQFYSEVALQGKGDMAWNLSSTGFRMTLSGYIPDLLQADFGALVNRALGKADLSIADISHWCIHPGGKRILQTIGESLGLDSTQLAPSFQVMREFGNMSSPTILFVLKEMGKVIKEKSIKEKGVKEKGEEEKSATMRNTRQGNVPAEKPEYVFGAAFGPGLTMETFIATVI